MVGAAVAAPDTSSFDGTYNGRLTPAPALEQRACSPQDITSLRVNDGEIQKDPGLPSFSGSINGKGFVEGYMNKADGSKVPIQGRAITGDDGKVRVTAGVIDNAAGCAWTLDLARQ
jgi:hypothetical protein